MDDVAAALAADNKELRARLRALEQSRWNRLNPFRFLRRSNGYPQAPAPLARSAIDEAREANPALADFEREIVARGHFTHLWALGHAGWWEPICTALDGRYCPRARSRFVRRPVRVLPVWRPTRGAGHLRGHVRGQPRARRHGHGAGRPRASLRRERRARGRCTGTKAGRAARASCSRDSRKTGERFDLVYLDGSHFGLDVLVDAAVSWQLLGDGGFLVFDDYLWAELGEDALLRPRPAIDAFLALVEGKYEPRVRARAGGRAQAPLARSRAQARTAAAARTPRTARVAVAAPPPAAARASRRARARASAHRLRARRTRRAGSTPEAKTRAPRAAAESAPGARRAAGSSAPRRSEKQRERPRVTA